MPKIRYKKYTPKPETKELIDTANTILLKLHKQGYSLTLRQLYYQLVARNIIENNVRSYNKLGGIMKRAREGGLTDWLALVDRVRPTYKADHWKSGKEYLQEAMTRFRKDLWEGQRIRCEVWVEKDALIEVAEKAAAEYDVPYMACRGYMSTSATWQAAHNRFLKGDVNHYIILHLADHDPSGINMTKDLAYRLEMFSTPYGDYTRPVIEVRRIALTMDQVEEFNLPPNYAKETDGRYQEYVEEFGEHCWELDALDPTYITQLIEDEIESIADMDLLESRREEQEEISNKFETLYQETDW